MAISTGSPFFETPCSYFVAGDPGIRPGEQQDGESAHG